MCLPGNWLQPLAVSFSGLVIYNEAISAKGLGKTDTMVTKDRWLKYKARNTGSRGGAGISV
jgi:hypothetical protein